MIKLNLLITSVALAIVTVLTSADQAQAQNISLTIKGIKSTKGQILVSVFKDNESFRNEKPFATFPFSKAAMQNGTLIVGLTLQTGTYGIAMLDDENGDGKMAKNILRIPKEGFGFSNFYLSGMSKPGFNDFKFEIKSSPIKIESRLRYM